MVLLCGLFWCGVSGLSGRDGFLSVAGDWGAEVCEEFGEELYCMLVAVLLVAGEAECCFCCEGFCVPCILLQLMLVVLCFCDDSVEVVEGVDADEVGVCGEPVFLGLGGELGDRALDGCLGCGVHGVSLVFCTCSLSVFLRVVNRVTRMAWGEKENGEERRRFSGSRKHVSLVRKAVRNRQRVYLGGVGSSQVQAELLETLTAMVTVSG